MARQFLTESLLLAVTGGCAGVALAFAGVRIVRAFGPASVPRIHDVTIDLTVLLYAAVISVVCGLLFGMVPVLRVRNPELSSALKESGRGGSGGVHDRRGRGILVVAQVTLAVLLVNGAALLIKSFSRLSNVNPGFRTENVLTANISLPARHLGQEIDQLRRHRNARELQAPRQAFRSRRISTTGWRSTFSRPPSRRIRKIKPRGIAW